MFEPAIGDDDGSCGTTSSAAAAQVRPHAELLVHDRPRRAQLPQACMNIDRQVQQRSMFCASKSGDGRISGIAPGISSGVPPVAGSENIVSTLASV